jgi:putative FmdB family regulatory protein
MPFYEYVCGSCGAQTEILQKISDPPTTECPSCHADSLVKRVSAAGFRLKGGGWYETDFKSTGKRNVAGDAAPDGDSKDQSKGQSKDQSKSHGCAAGTCGCATRSAESSAAPA